MEPDDYDEDLEALDADELAGVIAEGDEGDMFDPDTDDGPAVEQDADEVLCSRCGAAVNGLRPGGICGGCADDDLDW